MSDSPLSEIDVLQKKDLSVLIVSNKDVKNVLEFITELGIKAEFFDLDEDHKQNVFTAIVMAKAVKYAKSNGFQLVIAVDPEENRINIAVLRSPEGEFQILNVHQMAAMVADLVIRSMDVTDKIFLKSFRLTDMVERMAGKNKARCISFFPEEATLSEQIEKYGDSLVFYVNENHEFYLPGENLLLQIIKLLIDQEAQLHDLNKTLFDNLILLYREYGFYKEKSMNVNLEQKSQYKHFYEVMDSMRKNTPSSLNNLEIRMLLDYKKGRSKNLLSGKEMKMDIPVFNAIMILFSDGSSIFMWLTENKMTYNVSLRSSLHTKDQYDDANQHCNKEILKILHTVNRTN